MLYSRVVVYITKTLGWALVHSQGNDGVGYIDYSDGKDASSHVRTDSEKSVNDSLRWRHSPN